MPRLLRKRLGVRRRKRTGKSWLNKKYSVKDIAVSAWRSAKYIKSLINVERKFFDSPGVAPSNVTDTPTIINLSNIAQGNDYNNREGNSILCQSLQWRIQLATNVTSQAQSVRIIIFRDNDQRGTDPAVTDLLESTVSGYGMIVSPLLHYVNKRFSVLSDKVYTLSSNGDTFHRSIKKFMKFPPGTHIKYQSTAGADASNWEGALYALFVTDQTTANFPTISYYFRLRFTDN